MGEFLLGETKFPSGKVTEIESKIIKDDIKTEAIQDVQVKVLSDRVVDLDAKLIRMALHLDEEFDHLYLTTVTGQRWIFSRRAIDKGLQDGLAADIDHGKAGRVLAKVATYDPAAEVNYVAVVNALRAVDFPLLAQLASYKDSSLADLIDLPRLEGPAAKAPEAEHLQPSPDQLMLLIHRLEIRWLLERFLFEPLSAKNPIGETSTLGVPAAVATTTASSTTFAKIGSVPPIPYAKAPPSSIAFKKEELDTTPEHTAAPHAYIYCRIL
uniref:Uncharacterized protein n=1 Tax=Tanacetum cinerariifolium TaxID=118510 RepID=A0A699GRY2_TANCI|nr:hypothetical protein [Tanacetum cinerariifolium]